MHQRREVLRVERVKYDGLLSMTLRPARCREQDDRVRDLVLSGEGTSLLQPTFDDIGVYRLWNSDVDDVLALEKIV